MDRKILFLILLLIVIPITQQRSFSHRHSQQIRYNQTAYANQLAKRQQQFQNKMKQIDTQVTQLDSQISKFEGNDTYQTMKLQEGLADQRDALYDVESSLNKPFALKPCEKPNLTDQQKTKLNQQLKTTNQSLFNMKAQVKKCTSKSIQQCTVSDELIHQITRAQIYLSVMDDYINGNCSRVPRVIDPQQATGLVDLNDRLFKDNLKAPNWVYGNITQEQYRLIVFSQTTKFNMTTCPLQTPFANKINNTCFNCPEGSIFSLGERICTCPTGFKFDQETNQCINLTPVKPCNQTGTCVSMCPKDKPKWNALNKLCQACPSDKPIVNRNSSTCQACPQLKPLWNQVTYQCEECPKNSHFVPKESKCIPCKDQQKYDESTKKCVSICKQYQIYNKQQGKCYSLQELNGCKCNQMYNSTLKECEDVCQNGLQWLSSQKKCGPASLPDFKDKCKYYQRLNKQNNECQNYCDSTVAWYDRQNHVCIKIGCSVECKCGQIFDNLTGKCIPENHQCPAQQFYNLTSGQCQIFCKQGLVYSTSTKKCQKANIFTVSCADDEKYDSGIGKCIKKCTGNLQVFNSSTKNCDCLKGYVQDSNSQCVSIESTCSADKFQIYNPSLIGCECIDGYHFDSSLQTCIQNPVFCDSNRKLIYSKNENRCICREGYQMDNMNNCISICSEQSNKIYNITTKICVCKPDYYLSPDGTFCLHISSKCQSGNNMFYNQTSKSCQCNKGFFMSTDGISCISLALTCLSQNNQHYDPSTMTCVCDEGFIFNATNNKCYSQRIACNETLHFIYNSQTRRCECALGYKLSIDGLSCSSLAQVCLKNPNTVFNSLTSMCECLPGYRLLSQNVDILTCQALCKADETFNQNTQQCVDLCPFDYYYNLTTHSCVYRCQAEYEYNNATKQCQRVVKVCPDPFNQFYDAKTGQCHYCPSGYTLNTNTLICEKKTVTCASGQFLDEATGTCKFCRQGQVYNVLKKVCEFLNTTCSSGLYFNFNTGQCKSCASGLFYDQSLLECRQNCTTDQIFDYTTRKCVMISATCNNYQYYNATQKVCVNKPICLSSQRYDQLSRKCMDIRLITSKNAKNLIHSDFGAYQQYYDSQKAKDQYLKDCPDTTPFYSTTLKGCVICPETHPYFNLESQKCQDCGNDKYDTSIRKCVSLVAPSDTSKADLQNLDYSLDRLMMNII